MSRIPFFVDIAYGKHDITQTIIFQGNKYDICGFMSYLQELISEGSFERLNGSLWYAAQALFGTAGYTDFVKGVADRKAPPCYAVRILALVCLCVHDTKLMCDAYHKLAERAVKNVEEDGFSDRAWYTTRENISRWNALLGEVERVLPDFSQWLDFVTETIYEALKQQNTVVIDAVINLVTRRKEKLDISTKTLEETRGFCDNFNAFYMKFAALRLAYFFDTRNISMDSTNVIKKTYPTYLGKIGKKCYDYFTELDPKIYEYYEERMIYAPIFKWRFTEWSKEYGSWLSGACFPAENGLIVALGGDSEEKHCHKIILLKAHTMPCERALALNKTLAEQFGMSVSLKQCGVMNCSKPIETIAVKSRNIAVKLEDGTVAIYQFNPFSYTFIHVSSYLSGKKSDAQWREEGYAFVPADGIGDYVDGSDLYQYIPDDNTVICSNRYDKILKWQLDVKPRFCTFGSGYIIVSDNAETWFYAMTAYVLPDEAYEQLEQDILSVLSTELRVCLRRRRDRQRVRIL